MANGVYKPTYTWGAHIVEHPQSATTLHENHLRGILEKTTEAPTLRKLACSYTQKSPWLLLTCAFSKEGPLPKFYLLLDSKIMFLYCAVSPFLLLRKQSTSEVGRSLYFQMPRVAQPPLKPLRRALVDERFRIVTLTCPYSYTSIQWQTLSRL